MQTPEELRKQQEQELQRRISYEAQLIVAKIIDDKQVIAAKIIKDKQEKGEPLVMDALATLTNMDELAATLTNEVKQEIIEKLQEKAEAKQLRSEAVIGRNNERAQAIEKMKSAKNAETSKEARKLRGKAAAEYTVSVGKSTVASLAQAWRIAGRVPKNIAQTVGVAAHSVELRRLLKEQRDLELLVKGLQKAEHLQAQSPAEHVKVGSVSSETLVVIEATEKKIQRIKDDIKEHIANGMIEGKVNKKHVAEALSDFAASVRDARKGQKNTSQSIENRSESVREHFKKSRSGGGAETHKSSNSIVYAHPKVQKHDRLDALLESEAKQPPRLPPRGSKPSIDV